MDRKVIHMLDDLKMIHERDGQDALGIAGRQWQQLAHTFVLPEAFKRGAARQISNIVYTGMGGSAVSAMMAKAWLGTDRPFEVIRDYDLPAYVGEGTLCIVGSYSGNSEESVSILRQAAASGAQVVVLAKGGRMQAFAAENGLPFLQLPDVAQARFGTWYGLKALAVICDAYGLTEGRTLELAGQQDWFQAGLKKWGPEVPTARNEAKQIALELMGKSIVVYAGPKMAAVAYKWKTGFNENAKHVAWWSQYSECDHNEFVGWTRQPVQKPYAIIDIRSNLEHERIQKRFVASEKLLSGIRPSPIVITPAGDNLLQHMLYTAALGDYISIYLALLGGINPSSLDMVDKLKKELGEYV